ncbi:hypothetical protein PR048_026586 [Dryococelus australis]|uniref:DUF5641 domain-containing protein n=1 Tax=Dryococelus australis TaxID=614101 RepID=A0ABQ9GLR9_9NEOP|nr:hypothetical protein PR048_026586 [Dryococelus australis]
MARIEKLHPGKDGVVRVVTEKNLNGELVRPTSVWSNWEEKAKETCPYENTIPPALASFSECRHGACLNRRIPHPPYYHPISRAAKPRSSSRMGMDRLTDTPTCPWPITVSI